MKKLNPFIKILLLFIGYFTIVLGGRFILFTTLHIDKEICRILLIILEVIYLFILMKLWNLESIISFQPKSFFRGLIIGLSMILFCTFGGIVGLEDVGDTPFTSISHIYYWIIVYIISAGFVEEVMTRGFIINLVIEKFPFTRKRNVIIACTISAVLFGLTHIMNMASTGEFPLGQILQTTGMGLIFGAIYVRTRCIWSNIAVHAYWDIMIGLSSILFAIEKTTASKTLIEDLTFSGPVLLVYILIFIFLMREKKKNEYLVNE